MKMNKIIKYYWEIKVYLIILLSLCLWFGSITYISYNYISDSGGTKQIIISIGKEIKDIMDQINE